MRKTKFPTVIIDGFRFVSVDFINANRSEIAERDVDIKEYYIDAGIKKSYEDKANLTKFYSPLEDYNFTFPIITKYNGGADTPHSVRDDRQITIYSTQKPLEPLFSLTCCGYRNNVPPLFFMFQEKTYLFYKSNDDQNYDCGPYHIVDMKGRICASSGSFSMEFLPCQFGQEDENTLLLNGWIWHPCEITETIDISNALKTGKFFVDMSDSE